MFYEAVSTRTMEKTYTDDPRNYGLNKQALLSLMPSVLGSGESCVRSFALQLNHVIGGLRGEPKTEKIALLGSSFLIIQRVCSPCFLLPRSWCYEPAVNT